MQTPKSDPEVEAEIAAYLKANPTPAHRRYLSRKNEHTLNEFGRNGDENRNSAWSFGYLKELTF